MPWGDIAGSPWFQIGYPLLAGLGSAASPAAARGIYGLNAGMHLANQYADQQQNQEAQKRLAQVFSGEKFVTPQVQGAKPLGSSFTPEEIAQTPATTFSPVASTGPSANAPVGEQDTTATPDMALSNVAPAISPNVAAPPKEPIFTPAQRALGEALAASRGGTDEAYKLAASVMNPPVKPGVNVAPGHVVYNPNTGKAEYTAPAEVKPPTYSYHETATGNQKLQQRFNPATGKLETIGPPLPMELAPGAQERLDILQQNAGLAQQRAAQAEANSAANRDIANQRLGLAQDTAKRAEDAAKRQEEAAKVAQNQPGQQIPLKDAKAQISALKRQGLSGAALEKAANDLNFTIIGGAPETTQSKIYSALGGTTSEVQLKPLTRAQRAGRGASGSFGAAQPAAPPKILKIEKID